MSPDLERQLFKIQCALRNCAERDPDDVIANRASALAVKLEGYGSVFGSSDITELDAMLIRYCVGKHLQLQEH